MVAAQPHRNDRAQATPSGSLNRGFVSLDPERQPEPLDDPGRRRPKAAGKDQFASVVQQLVGAARRRRDEDQPGPGPADRA